MKSMHVSSLQDASVSLLKFPIPTYSLFPLSALTILITLPPSVGLFSNFRSFAYRFSYDLSVSSSSTPHCSSSPCPSCPWWWWWLCCEPCDPWLCAYPCCPKPYGCCCCGIAIGAVPLLNWGRPFCDMEEERRWCCCIGCWGALVGEEE